MKYLLRALICKLFGHRDIELGWMHDSDSGTIYLTKCNRCNTFSFCTR